MDVLWTTNRQFAFWNWKKFPSFSLVAYTGTRCDWHILFCDKLARSLGALGLFVDGAHSFVNLVAFERAVAQHHRSSSAKVAAETTPGDGIGATSGRTPSLPRAEENEPDASVR